MHDLLAGAEVQPFFALGWFITWFAHSVDSLQHISRLFDLFMASHPLMPLYVTAIVIKVYLFGLAALGQHFAHEPLHPGNVDL